MPSAKELSKLINQGRLVEVRELVEKGAPLEQFFKDIHGNFLPLARAARLGHRDIVQALLDLGADVNGPPAEPWLKNALLASFWNKTAQYTRIAELLIENGADVNHLSFSQDGEPVGTVLMEACRSSHVKVVNQLIDHGAEINAQVIFGTPLTMAIESNRIDAVEALLTAGANLDLRYPENGGTVEFRGLTPKEIAIKLRRQKIISRLNEED